MNVGINTVILFDSDDTNQGQPPSYQAITGLAYDSVTNPGRFDYGDPSSITLVVSWQIGWQAQNSGSRGTWLAMNGDLGNRYGYTTVTAGLVDTLVSSSTTITLQTGDYFEIYGLQTSAASVLNTGADAGGATLGRTNRVQITRI